MSASESVAPIVARLAKEFEGDLSFEAVEKQVLGIAEGLSGARVTLYVPLLVERQARTQLRAAHSKAAS